MSTHLANRPRLRKGVEVTVPGEGRYRFIRFRADRHEFDCWGPIDPHGACPRGRVRTFLVEQIGTVHRKVRGR